MTTNSRLDLTSISAALSLLGIGDGSPCLAGAFRGGQCQVFKLTFQNSESLAVRVPFYPEEGDQKIQALRSEVDCLQLLERIGFLWAPRCRGYSLTFDNPTKHPFIVLTWIEGTRLNWNDHYPPQPLRNRLLGEMALIQLSLIQCTLKDGSTTAKDYFDRLINNRCSRIREGKLSNISEQDCIDQKTLLSLVLGKDHDNMAFAMDHGDFKPDNIIVDSDYGIKGVIDWAFAALVPIPRAAGLLRFLWPDSLIHRPRPALQQDRQTFIASIAAHTSQAALYMRRMQGAQDVDFRTLYLESLFSKGMHHSLVQARWKLPYSEISLREECLKGDKDRESKE